MSKMSYFVYIDGILGIETNVEKFSWSYGTVAPLATEEDFSKCCIKLYIKVVNDNYVFPKDNDKNTLGKFHYFSGNPKEHKIFYDRNYFFGKHLRFSIEMSQKSIFVIVGKTYFKHVHHRIMNLHSLGYILTDLTAGLLLLNGYATLHCSAVNFSEQNRSIILFAPPNTGKTLTSMRLCQQHEANFIAEDFALTNGKLIWSVPWTSTFRFYDELNQSGWDKLINKIVRIIPAFELISLSKKKAINKYIGPNRIVYKSNATDIFILERGKKSISYDKSGVLDKILTLNRYEFNYHKAPTLVALSYFNPDISPEKMLDYEKKIMSQLLDECKYSCVQVENALEYSEIIYEKLMNKNF